MAWTAPRTWVSGETITATILNTHIRDNLNAIGAAWTTYTPTLTGFTVSSTSRARYVQAGKWITVQYRAVLNAAPTGSMNVTLPFTAASTYVGGAGGDVHGECLGYDTSAGAYHLGAAICVSAALNKLQFQSNTGTATWNATAPWTWASGDILSFNVAYESA